MAGETPNVSTLTKLYYSNTLGGTKTQIAYVQEIPQIKTTPEPITYSAIDIDDERQAKGRKTIEDIEITALFTEAQHDAIKALEEADNTLYWFIQLPEATAITAGKPLTFYFQAKVSIALDTISIDEMLQDIIKLYRSSEVMESKGFPTSSI